jgi:hypothetical protein
MERIFKSESVEEINRLLQEVDIFALAREEPREITFVAYREISDYLHGTDAWRPFRLVNSHRVAVDVRRVFNERVSGILSDEVVDSLYRMISYVDYREFEHPALSDYLIQNIRFTDRWMKYLNMFCVRDAPRISELGLELLVTNRANGIFLLNAYVESDLMVSVRNHRTEPTINEAMLNVRLQNGQRLVDVGVEICMDANNNIKRFLLLLRFPPNRVDIFFQLLRIRSIGDENDSFRYTFFKMVYQQKLPIQATRDALRHLIETRQFNVVYGLMKHGIGPRDRRIDELLYALETVDDESTIYGVFGVINAIQLQRRTTRMGPRALSILLSLTSRYPHWIPYEIAKIAGTDLHTLETFKITQAFQLILHPRNRVMHEAPPTRDIVSLTSQMLLGNVGRETDDLFW